MNANPSKGSVDLPPNPPRETDGTPTKPASSTSSDNVVDLLRDLVGQGTHLADQQLSLIKAEVRESAADVKMAIGGIAGAAVVGISGLGVLLMGLAYLLADAIDSLAWATIIVGLTAMLAAFLLYRGAASKMNARALTPDRTQRTLARTPDAVRGQL